MLPADASDRCSDDFFQGVGVAAVRQIDRGSWNEDSESASSGRCEQFFPSALHVIWATEAAREDVDLIARVGQREHGRRTADGLVVRVWCDIQYSRPTACRRAGQAQHLVRHVHKVSLMAVHSWVPHSPDVG
jgi:hypothetical protein